MAEEIRCEACDRTFGDPEALAMHNSAKHPENVTKEKKPLPKKKIKRWVIFIIILGLIIFGFYYLFSAASNVSALPPTTMQGHIESNPASHVLNEPMSIPIQKHMLEHVDGQEGARGGVILNYDCENYSCEESLIENLEQFSETYDYVYVAPFKNMKVKIALTRLNKIETLDAFDQDVINTFILGG